MRAQNVVTDSDDRPRRMDDGTYVVRHDMRAGDLSATLAIALAAIEEVDPIELPEPLTAYVDPDALNALFRSTSDGEIRSDVTLSIEMMGYDVTIYGGGRIEIRLARR